MSSELNNQSKRTEKCAENPFGYLTARLGLREMTEFFVEHSFEFTGGHVAHRPVRLNGLQLVQTPVQLLERVQR